MHKKLLLLVVSSCLVIQLSAQLCTIPGQTPVTSMLVCGSESFTVTNPINCGSKSIRTPCNDGFPYTDKNPHFFRISCFNSGNLGFVITPSDITANYNWQLFDITNTNPSDVFTNPLLFVACNFSGEPGLTGASIDGTSLIVCSGPGNPFSEMPPIVAGRTYLLMVSNETGLPGSYDLLFNGNASITDPVEPHLQNARASCTSTEIVVRLNRRVQCNSIDPSGAEFTLSGGATITGAVPGVCVGNFGTDSVILSLSNPLLVGNYTVTIGNGRDGNTLVDICNRTIPEGESLPFSVTVPQPTPFDSITPTGCSPEYIEFVFAKPMLCNSIAADGSDFIITGPGIISVAPASCGASGKSSNIRLNITAPIATSGTYTVRLAVGSDGNTILDECGMETPPGGILTFTVEDPVSAVFTYNIPPSCNTSTASFFHDGNGNTISWNWNFGGSNNSSLQNPVRVFNVAGPQPVRLIVSNGKCTDTSSQTLTISGQLIAEFSMEALNCPGDTIHFVNKSKGGIDSWKWDFGNGTTSTVKTPVGFYYPEIGRENYYTISLIAYNTTLDCSDTIKHVIKTLSHCYIDVPTAFTPNGDSKNDFLYPLNALKADQLEFSVYNRYGQLVFFTRDWTKKWDGRVKGILQDTGIFAWQLSYTNRDTKQRTFLKGTTLLLR